MPLSGLGKVGNEAGPIVKGNQTNPGERREVGDIRALKKKRAERDAFENALNPEIGKKTEIEINRSRPAS